MVIKILNQYLNGGTNPIRITAVTVISILLVTLIDFKLGPQYATSIFYFIPIALSVWYGNRSLSVIVVALAAIAWFASDYIHPDRVATTYVLLWNASVRTITFIIVTVLLINFRNQYDSEKNASHYDALTGALSVRACHESLALELYRNKRLNIPFTLVYIDLDNFKFVNDQWGHAVGDDVLKATVDTLKKHTRLTDFIARLGGDEFLMYFSNMNEQDVKTVMKKLRDELSDVMTKKSWPITYSMGVVNFTTSPDSVNELIKIADSVMYRVKKSSKAAISYTNWPKNYNQGTVIIEPNLENPDQIIEAKTKT